MFATTGSHHRIVKRVAIIFNYDENDDDEDES